MLRSPPSLLAALALGSLLGCGSSRPVDSAGNGMHPAGFEDPAQHGAAAKADLASCQGCHGTDLNGAVGPSCTQCHADHGYPNWTSNCTFCHGDQKVATYTPADLRKAAPGPTHAKHLDGGDFWNGLGADCTACHVVPTDLTHVTGTVQVTFGPLATHSGALVPTYFSQTCSNVYCHGGNGTSITWTGTVSCGTCHQIPPADPATATHQHGWHVTANSFPMVAGCQTCHLGYTATTVDKSIHVNGAAQATLSDGTQISGWNCTACHTKLGVTTP